MAIRARFGYPEKSARQVDSLSRASARRPPGRVADVGGFADRKSGGGVFVPLKLKCRCGEKLSAPESAAGKKGKCPKCGMTFVIPGGAAVGAGAPAHSASGATSAGGGATTAAPAKPTVPADPFGLDLPKLGASGPLDDLFDESFDASMTAGTTLPANPYASPKTVSKPKKAGSARAGMNRVANGIKLVFWGSVMAVIGAVAGALAKQVAPLGGAEVALLAATAGLFIQFAGSVLSVIGRILCLAVPPQVGAKGLIVTAVALDVVAILLGVLIGVGAIHPAVGLGVAALGNIVTFFLFVFFVRKVALSVKRKDLADDAKMVLVMIGVTVLSIPALIIPCIGALFFLGMILFVMFKYLNLLQHTAEAARC